MLRVIEGDLFQSEAEALVNTVNTVGVMGKGIALQFKRAFPANYRAYESAVAKGEVKLGQVYVYRTGHLEHPRYILNFPTKKHWRSKSRLADIESGLADLRSVLIANQIASVAIPPLGCGQGGLTWAEVRPRIEMALSDLEHVDIELFAPNRSPAPRTMPSNTSRPKMTRGRAAIVLLVDRYLQPGYSANNLEVQKLAYFLQTRGEPLRLAFVAGKYGPYAEALQHVLQRIDGHFIHGYGDRASAASIVVDSASVVEAKGFADSVPGMTSRLDEVAEAITGFETPYGLELLATVHWVSIADGLTDPGPVVERVQAWSSRKADLFTDSHIEVAWDRLVTLGWLSTTATKSH